MNIISQDLLYNALYRITKSDVSAIRGFQSNGTRHNVQHLTQHPRYADPLLVQCSAAVVTAAQHQTNSQAAYLLAKMADKSLQ